METCRPKLSSNPILPDHGPPFGDDGPWSLCESFESKRRPLCSAYAVTPVFLDVYRVNMSSPTQQRRTRSNLGPKSIFFPHSDNRSDMFFLLRIFFKENLQIRTLDLPRTPSSGKVDPSPRLNTFHAPSMSSWPAQPLQNQSKYTRGYDLFFYWSKCICYKYTLRTWPLPSWPRLTSSAFFGRGGRLSSLRGNIFPLVFTPYINFILLYISTVFSPYFFHPSYQTN